MITEHFEGIYGLPALTDDITDMIADGQMIGHYYSEDRESPTQSVRHSHDICSTVCENQLKKRQILQTTKYSDQNALGKFVLGVIRTTLS